MRRLTSLFILWTVLPMFSAAPESPSKFLTFSDGGRARNLPCLVRQEGAYVSALELMSAMSGSCVWSAEKRKLLAHLEGRDIQFTEANPYASVGDTLVNLVYPPLVVRGDFLLYLPTLADLLRDLLGRPFTWNGSSLVLSSGTSGSPVAPVSRADAGSPDTVSTAAPIIPSRTAGVIRKSTCEVRKNGTLFTLFMPESLGFDFTYFKPQLNLNIVHGRLSAAEVTSVKPAGLLKEIEAIQFADNAQISLIVADAVKFPEVVYRADPSRLEVTLRTTEKSSEGAPPLPPLPPRDTVPTAAQVQPKDSLKPQAKPLPKIRTVIIDPGHGGKDPGAVNEKLKAEEKNITLAIGRELARLIKSGLPDVRAVLTRDDDTFIPLKDRSSIANHRNGDLFISIHINSIKGSASKKGSVGGYCVYFLDVARDDAARAAAALENSVLDLEADAGAGEAKSDLDFILKSSEINIYRNESQEFAILLEQEMNRHFIEIKRDRTGVSQAGFYVLQGPQMPAVLVETAYISNPSEAKLLLSGEFQRKVAAALFNSVVKFKEGREREDHGR